jgi:hypothetical protein
MRRTTAPRECCIIHEAVRRKLQAAAFFYGTVILRVSVKQHK